MNIQKIMTSEDIPEIRKAVYFVIHCKFNNYITLSIHKTDNIKEANQNNIISNYYFVNKPDEFIDFLTSHPLLKNLKEGDNYVLSEENYKKLVKLGKKQHKYYNLDELSMNVEQKIINITRGYKIQKYSLDGKLLKTYIGIRDATRNDDISDTSLKTAIVNKTVYAGHRWLYLDRNLGDDTVQDIGDSVHVNKHKKSLIAMIDIDNTEIVNVFENQKVASIARKLKSSSAIYQSIVKGNLCSGHYFKYYDDCSEEFKEKYLEKVGGVLPDNSNKGITIKQIDYLTGNIIKEFPSIIDLQKHFQMSNKCIKKAIETGEIVKGFKWSY